MTAIHTSSLLCVFLIGKEEGFLRIRWLWSGHDGDPYVMIHVCATDRWHLEVMGCHILHLSGICDISSVAKRRGRARWPVKSLWLPRKNWPMSTTTRRGCPDVPTVLRKSAVQSITSECFAEMGNPWCFYLVTNDDGPCSEDESPFIYSFSELLIAEFLGSERSKLKVVIPDSQASWIGKSYLIKNKLTVVDYDPSTRTKSTDPSSTSTTALLENPWKLVSGTPASCSNLGLFNLFPAQIDLVISGPNYGRNTSSAFSLSSGTVG
jgi:hypothetical protein